MDRKVITKKTCDLLQSDCDLLYHKLSHEFDNSLLRPMKSQRLAFKHKDYRITYIEDYGFGLWWCFDEFTFVEYLIVEKEFRGQGVGSIILNAIKRTGLLVILEIDTRSNVLYFYLRNNFKECLLDYSPIQINETPQHKLKLMSYNHALSIDEYNVFLKKISSDELQF